MALLSIIVTVYNAEKYLAECLDSILNQTFTDYEIICIDDGSTDDSLNILYKYESLDSRIKVYSQKNAGPSKARNEGLRLASGKYIAFVDSDDFLEKNAYEVAVKYINDVDIVCFGIEVFGDYSLKTRKSDTNYYKVHYKGKTQLNNKIRHKIDCSVCNKIFKKDLIVNKHLKFPEGIRYEDAAFYWKYIINAQTAYFIEQNFYKYRRRENSIMAETFENGNFAVDHLYVMDDLYEYLLTQKKLEPNFKLFQTLFKEYFLCAYNYAQSDRKDFVLQLGTSYAKKYFSLKKSNNNLINFLIKQNYNRIFEPDLTFLQKIFSMKNIQNYKVITILGFRIKIQRGEK